MKLLSAALLLATAAAEDFSNDAAASSDGGRGGSYADANEDEDVVQEFLPKMSFSAKDYFREKEAKGACLFCLEKLDFDCTFANACLGARDCYACSFSVEFY
jgi:hypothetical protein